MNFIAENWILLLVAIASGGMLLAPMLRGSKGGLSVSANEAVRQINREKGVLIDVSEPDEYAAGHAIGAKNVPFGKVEDSKQLPSNKGLPILLICPSGARAGRAAGLLRKAGYEKAVSVAGGTNAWRDAGLPVEKGSEAASEKSSDKSATSQGKQGKQAKAAKGAEKPAAKPVEAKAQDNAASAEGAPAIEDASATAPTPAPDAASKAA